MNGDSWDDRNMISTEADLTPETLEEIGFPARVVNNEVIPSVAHMLFRFFSKTLRISNCSWLECTLHQHLRFLNVKSDLSHPLAQVTMNLTVKALEQLFKIS
jgi:hypothetical protein